MTITMPEWFVFLLALLSVVLMLSEICRLILIWQVRRIAKDRDFSEETVRHILGGRT